MALGDLSAEDADKNVVEAARLLVGNMVRNRPYMMLMHVGDDEQVIGYFHTLHDLHRFGRHHQITDYSIWTRVGAHKAQAEDEYDDDDDEYDDDYEGEEENEEEDDDDDDQEEEDELPGPSTDLPAPSADLDDLLSTDLSDLDDEDLDEEF